MWKSALKIVGLGAVMALGACDGESPSAFATTGAAAATDTATIEALDEAADNAHSLELAGWIDDVTKGDGESRRAESVAWSCDPSPVLESVEICEHSVPASAHFKWSECAVRPSGAGGRGCAHGDGDGAQPPEPPPADASGRQGPPPGPPGMRLGVSSGTVNVTTAVAAASDNDSDEAVCSDAVYTFERVVTFDVTTAFEHGGSATSSGTFTTMSNHALGVDSALRTTTIDATRTDTDAAGNLDRSIHLTGTLSIAFDDVARTRTFNGTVNASSGSGAGETLTLADLVRAVPRQCRWPIAGSLVRTAGDESHTLVFGPECGQATLDGEAIELPAQGRGPGRDDGPPLGAGHGPSGPPPM